MKIVYCPYCGMPAALTTGRILYPKRPELKSRVFYFCAPCQAWVGCHRKTMKPMGTLAKADLRGLRMAVHRCFDPLWKEWPFGNRDEAYAWLGKVLRLEPKDCHVALFDVATCKKALEAIDNFTEQLRKRKSA